MNRLWLLASLVSVAVSAAAPAEEKMSSGYDLKPQAMLDLKSLHKKFVDLAEAIPADKYAWRPQDGVRSLSEVFLHVAGTNFQMPHYLGAAPPESFHRDGYEKSASDKAKVIEQLNQSFDYAEKAVDNLTDADLRKPVKELGPEANMGDVVYIITAHAHEHLGQSIAYARENGVTPPWSKKAKTAAPHDGE